MAKQAEMTENSRDMPESERRFGTEEAKTVRI